jgi:hypothetical protein
MTRTSNMLISTGVSLAAGVLLFPAPLLRSTQARGDTAATAQAQGVATLDQDHLDFGKQVVGRIAPAKILTVTNTGTKSLYINSAQVRGDQSRHFRITRDFCTGSTVAPNRSCVLSVRFVPANTGDRSADLVLTDGAPDSPQHVALSGTGINSVDVPPFGSP